MNDWLARGLLGLGLILALGVPLRFVVQAEQHVAHGESLFLELAPVDPRSLLLGDYMALDYAIHQQMQWDDDRAVVGTVVVSIDERGVVTGVRRDEGTELGPRERRLAFQGTGWLRRVGPDAFFFQEGNAGLYEDARYGELRVSASGTAILVGLRDRELEVLGPVGDHPLQMD